RVFAPLSVPHLDRVLAFVEHLLPMPRPVARLVGRRCPGAPETHRPPLAADRRCVQKHPRPPFAGGDLQIKVAALPVDAIAEGLDLPRAQLVNRLVNRHRLLRGANALLSTLLPTQQSPAQIGEQRSTTVHGSLGEDKAITTEDD